ncbi:hypothetical protein GCM10011521_16230 [Arenimonas soli]|uniref:Lipoprotein n=1 Tax=Arenimonas soli TaxID=2269504 RepID=A0ABQ1HJX6_9GAMM|nr:hypothetical protein GCM10011521_16230 [Arenimonas soli]
MNFVDAAAALLLNLSGCAHAADPIVPDRFVAHWAGSPDACGSKADDLALRIGAKHIEYWESQGPIRASVTRGNEIALIAELHGEGEAWLATASFTLSDDGLQLVDRTTIPGREVVRHRCPGTAATRPN